MCLSARPLLVKNQVMNVGEERHPDHGYVHVFGVTASVAMQYDGENVLIFPVPCNEPLSKSNIIALRKFSVFPNMMSALKRESPTKPELPDIKPDWMIANSPSAI